MCQASYDAAHRRWASVGADDGSEGVALAARYGPATFRETYGPAAARNEIAHRVPALFTLAQSGLETGWGRHAPGNMMFGIKATPQWTGKRQLCVTTEVFADKNHGGRFPAVISIVPRAGGGYLYKVKDWFRAYDDPFESFADHAKMLRANPRYAAAFLTRDPREFARRIAAGGYATAPNYAAALVAMIGQLESVPRERDLTANQGVRPQKSVPRERDLTANQEVRPLKENWFARWLLALLGRRT